MKKVGTSCLHVPSVYATEEPRKEQIDDPHDFRDIEITFLTRKEAQHEIAVPVLHVPS